MPNVVPTCENGTASSCVVGSAKLSSEPPTAEPAEYGKLMMTGSAVLGLRGSAGSPNTYCAVNSSGLTGEISLGNTMPRFTPEVFPSGTKRTVGPLRVPVAPGAPSGPGTAPAGRSRNWTRYGPDPPAARK